MAATGTFPVSLVRFFHSWTLAFESRSQRRHIYFKASVAFMLYPSIQGFVPNPDWLPFAATATLSLFFGMISALMKDKVVVLVTSIYGHSLHPQFFPNTRDSRYHQLKYFCNQLKNLSSFG